MTGRDIAECARDFLVENRLCGTMFGDGAALDAIAARAGMDTDPYTARSRWNRILGALDGCPDLFDKYLVPEETLPEGYQVRMRYFRLRGIPPLDEPGAVRAPPRGTHRGGKTIAQHARDYLKKHGLSCVTWGDAAALGEIARRSTTRGPGAYREAEWRRVMDGLSRASGMFEKEIVLVPHGEHGWRKRVRRFRLREAA